MNKKIAILPGDGIGPEVIAEAVNVLKAIEQKFGHSFTLEYADIGGVSIDNHGLPLTDAALKTCGESDAILLGAVGGPKWDDPSAEVRPEQGLLRLRGELALFANLRPLKIHPALADRSPLKNSYLENVDIMLVRELTGGIYFGERTESLKQATDVCTYSDMEVRRIVRVAAGLAMQRKKRLVSIDKANVLATSRLWRAVTADTLVNEFPQIHLSHLLVDAAAMHLLQRPATFDVMVTENLFGDILTDEASVLAGSIGLLPSASLNEGGVGLYEPIHGSAPDIAGQSCANPYGTIASVAMMLRHSLAMADEAQVVEDAIEKCLDEELFTPDLAASNALSTQDVGHHICTRITEV